MGAPATPNIVLVGIDEASVESAAEPVALWHKRLAAGFTALAKARPRAVGVDVTLPDRSFDAFSPGGDAALAEAIVALNGSTQAAYALAIQADGRVRGVHPPLVTAMGGERLGLAFWPLDRDGVVRRYTPLTAEDGTTTPLLVERLAAFHAPARTSTQDRSRRDAVNAGWIDFAASAPFHYIPFADLLLHQHDETWLRERFANKTVLVGAVLPFEDEYRQPVNAAAWRQPGESRAAPGLTLYARALATLDRHGRYLTQQPLAVGLVGFGLMWLVLSLSVPRAAVAWLIAACAAVGLTFLLRASGEWLDMSLAVATTLATLLMRASYGAWRTWQTKQSLTRAFGGYVSPQLLQEIVSGSLDPFTPRQSTLAFLFVDLRDSTPLTRELSATKMVDLLNTFFAAVTHAIHAESGTVDNFRGDGVLAFFGAPRAVANPAQAAIDAALAIERARQSGQLGNIRLSMGIALGDAVTANVGGTERNNYTAIGEPVNLAARLQEVCKRENAVLVMDAATARATKLPPSYEAATQSEDVRGVGAVLVTIVRRADMPPTI